MLKIRLQRIGRRNDPSFRVVVIEHTRGSKSGNFVERVGSHNPKTKQTNLNAESITHWLSMGAQASDTVHNMLIRAGIIKGKKINALPKKTPVVKAEEEKSTSPEDSKDDSAQSEESEKEDKESKGAGEEKESV